MTPNETITVFETATTWGTGAPWGGVFTLPLRREWALDCTDLRVVFTRYRDRTCRVSVLDGKKRVLCPWYDHVDQMIADADPVLPVFAPDTRWEDNEQAWWASIARKRDRLYVAETDGDRLLQADRDGVRKPRLVEPGIVSFGRATVTWRSVGVEAWERAWFNAIATIQAP
ncbi:MAG: hypothetical protein ACRCYQ_14110 [Nocardioides sp.]